MAYTTGINENLLVSGATAAAPKFAGYSKEIGKFKENLQANAKLRQQQLDVEKKENDLRSAEYLSIDSVDTSGLGSDVLGATTEAAVNLKNKAFDLIKRKSEMSVTEFNVQYAGLLKEVQSLNGMNKIKKALGTQYIEAKKDGDDAPWADPEQQRLIQLVIDQDIKDKKWINKDGKMFLSVTKDGKTDEINLADLKPIETSDPSSYLQLEDAARKRLKTMSLNSSSLTEDRIRQVAEKSVLGLSDTEAKNAALYYVLTDVNTGTKRSLEEQRAYFRPKDGQTKEERMFEIRKDIANTLYNRELILYGNDLNKLKQPKPSAEDFTKSFQQQLIVGQTTANAIINATEQMTESAEGTANISDVEQAIKNLNVAKGIKIQDRNTAMGNYISSVKSDSENKMSLKEIQDDFNKQYPISSGNLFINDLPYNLDLTDKSKIAKFLFEYSGLNKRVQDYYLSRSYPPNLLSRTNQLP